MLLDMETELAALRALVYRCVQLQDRILGLERGLSKRPGRGHAGAGRAQARAARPHAAPQVVRLRARPVDHAHRGAGPRRLRRGPGLRRGAPLPRRPHPAHLRRHQPDPGPDVAEGPGALGAERPWRLFTGAVSVEATPDVLRRRRARPGRRIQPRAALRPAPPRRRTSPSRACTPSALAAMLAYTRAAEALAAHAPPPRATAGWPTASSRARCRSCACTATSSAAGTAAPGVAATREPAPRRCSWARQATERGGGHGEVRAHPRQALRQREPAPARPGPRRLHGLRRWAATIRGRGANIFTQWTGDPTPWAARSCSSASSATSAPPTCGS
jgi:hypothetical protein